MISIVFFSIFGYVQVLQVEQKVTQRSNSDMCLTWKSLCPTPTPCAATFVMINSGCRKLFQHVSTLWWRLVGFNIAPWSLNWGHESNEACNLGKTCGALRNCQVNPCAIQNDPEIVELQFASTVIQYGFYMFLSQSLTLWYSMVIESRPFMHEFPMTFI